MMITNLVLVREMVQDRNNETYRLAKGASVAKRRRHANSR